MRIKFQEYYKKELAKNCLIRLSTVKRVESKEYRRIWFNLVLLHTTKKISLRIMAAADVELLPKVCIELDKKTTSIWCNRSQFGFDIWKQKYFWNSQGDVFKCVEKIPNLVPFNAWHLVQFRFYLNARNLAALVWIIAKEFAVQLQAKSEWFWWTFIDQVFEINSSQKVNSDFDLGVV